MELKRQRALSLSDLGTLLHGKRASVELIVHVIACLAEDFLPFVNPQFVKFSPHLHDRLTATSGGIVAGAIMQHRDQDTQQPVSNVA
jgi:hypothetical protein